MTSKTAGPRSVSALTVRKMNDTATLIVNHLGRLAHALHEHNDSEMHDELRWLGNCAYVLEAELFQLKGHIADIHDEATEAAREFYDQEEARADEIADQQQRWGEK